MVRRRPDEVSPPPRITLTHAQDDQHRGLFRARPEVCQPGQRWPVHPLQIVYCQQQGRALGQVHAEPVQTVHRSEVRDGRIARLQAQRARSGPGWSSQEPAPLASGCRKDRLLKQLPDDRKRHVCLKLAAPGSQ